MAYRTTGRSQVPVGELVASLSIEQLREVVSAAADRHDDVERTVRLITARADDNLAALRAEVDRGLRTRRFLPYGESSGWVHGARPVVEELRRRATGSPSAELVELLQRAIGHVVKVIEHADDSDGTIGDLARELLELHATACDSGAADPVKLAEWMVPFWFADQDLFEVDPVRYQKALGEEGVAAYRQAVAAREPEDTFAVRYARERLAVLDGDTEKIVALLGGDLTSPHQFVQVVGAMAELGREDDVLVWCERGIAETRGWQTGRLYDLACETHARRGEPLEALRLRRSQHERMPSLSTYNALRRAAEAVDAWSVERDAARAVLRERDVRAFVDALLPTATWISRGTQRKPPRRSSSGATCGYGSPRAARPPTQPTRSRSTSEWPTESSRRPIAEPTSAPCGSSSAGETPRRPRATLKRSASTSSSSARNTAGARH
ncbi:MAG: hypothetical protein WB761_33890 [Solirubrobacteraceae bacterium]